MAIDLDNDPSELAGIQRSLGLNACVVVRRNATALEPSYFTAQENTPAGRMAMLAAALESAESGNMVEIISGSFAVANNAPLSSFLADGVTGVKIICRNGSTHEYVDPEDAAEDHDLFIFPKNIADFGLRDLDGEGDIQDNWKALQAAANCLPPRSGTPIFLDSGRRVKEGAALVFPEGIYYTSRTWEVSPCTVIQGVNSGTINSVLRPIADSDFEPGDYLIKMEDVADDALSKNNCFGASISHIRIDQVSLAGNPGLNGLYWYGAQQTEIHGVWINNFDGFGLTLYGGSIHQLWITNCSLSGLVWTGGGTSTLLSVERCNPEKQVDEATGRKYPFLDLSLGSFVFDFIQCEDSAPPSLVIDSILLLWAHEVALLSVGAIDLGSGTEDERTHTLVLLTGNCHNVNIHGMKCFPEGAGTITLVDDRSQQSPAGAGVSFTLMGNTGQYNQIDGGKPAGKTLSQIWTGFNQFRNQNYFGTGDAGYSQIFLSPEGFIDLGNAKIECTRATLFINNALPKPVDFNGGTITMTAAGALTLAGRIKASIPSYADDTAADADSALLSGQLYRTTGGGRTVFQKP